MEVTLSGFLSPSKRYSMVGVRLDPVGRLIPILRRVKKFERVIPPSDIPHLLADCRSFHLGPCESFQSSRKGGVHGKP